MLNFPNPQLAFAYGAPPTKARIREHMEDFKVDEVLGFEPEGEGSHAFLRIRKHGLNTQWVARQLTELAGVRSVDVGFSGLKDRMAVTSQWFSVNITGRAEPDWSRLNSDQLQLLHITRHKRKLRRGTHKQNQFSLVLRRVDGDTSDLERRLQRVAAQGVPNYFGEQRFGREGNNLEKAHAMFAGEIRIRDRHKRGLYLSAARSLLFNQVLSARVAHSVWNQPIDGDVMMLEGSHSIFSVDAVNDEIEQRVASGDIHPTGPLWGRGSLLSAKLAKQHEERVLEEFSEWRNGLEMAGLKQERRALRLSVTDISWRGPEKDELRLAFSLPRGAYATVVVRELVEALQGSK